MRNKKDPKSIVIIKGATVIPLNTADLGTGKKGWYSETGCERSHIKPRKTIFGTLKSAAVLGGGEAVNGGAVLGGL